MNMLSLRYGMVCKLDDADVNFTRSPTDKPGSSSRIILFEADKCTIHTNYSTITIIVDLPPKI